MTGGNSDVSTEIVENRRNLCLGSDQGRRRQDLLPGWSGRRRFTAPPGV